jgi:alpha-tubulin suppressor-like RCC1 family protein
MFQIELGEVWTTGWGKYGQLGHGTTNDELKPRKVSTIQRAQRIQAGWNFSLVLAGSFLKQQTNFHSSHLSE